MRNDTPLSFTLERQRHPFAARHVQLLAREHISPGFVRLTLGGPDLAGFYSAGFDDHVKLVLPPAGQDKPSLPRMVDGRPQIDGPMPVLRDYTPLHYDAAQQTLQLDFALHGTGPAATWARTAPIGAWVGLAGPRGSMVFQGEVDTHVLLGDESAMPAIERRLRELPAGTKALVRVQLADARDARDWHSPAEIDVQFTPSLLESLAALDWPSGSVWVWGGGERDLMAAARQALLELGVSGKQMRLSAYWKQGVADFHDDLPAA